MIIEGTDDARGFQQWKSAQNTRIEKTNIAMPGMSTVWRYDTIDLETGETVSRVSPFQFEYDYIVGKYEEQQKRFNAAKKDHLLYFLESPSMVFVEPQGRPMTPGEHDRLVEKDQNERKQILLLADEMKRRRARMTQEERL